jgi:UDP-N-acetylglucosamine 4,6-dehydratase
MNLSYTGKTVFISGGSGSWGKALTKRLLAVEKPGRIICYSRGEHAQESAAREFAALDPNKTLRFRIGDVRDFDRLKLAMRDVDYVFHAAALKIVPTCENDPEEAIKTNIIGTMNVTRSALECGVRKVMALSTDKAAISNTLYGSTKHCAEKLVVASNVYSGENGTRFSAVRYGNVAGSRGSFIPLFTAMAANGATSLPVTHKDMTRFLFSIEEAVEFTLSSLEMMAGGEVFIPKIAARRIVDVAREIAPHLPHEFIGIRPGEKIHETLVSEDESRMVLELSDSYVIQPNFDGWDSSHLIGARPVPEGFKFTSDSAIVSPSQLMEAAE